MNEMRVCLLVALLALGFAPAPLPRRPRGQSDLPKLQGEWVATRYVYWSAERKEPSGEFENCWFRFEGKRLSAYQRDRLIHDGEVSLTNEGGRSCIDWVVRWEYEGRPAMNHYKGVYRIEGGTVTVCWSRNGARPLDFAGGKKELYLFVLERRKP
jgi:uncharacterized protein (TIGR03067 family)